MVFEFRSLPPTRKGVWIWNHNIPTVIIWVDYTIVSILSLWTFNRKPQFECLLFLGSHRSWNSSRGRRNTGSERPRRSTVRSSDVPNFHTTFLDWLFAKHILDVARVINFHTWREFTSSPSSLIYLFAVFYFKIHATALKKKWVLLAEVYKNINFEICHSLVLLLCYAGKWNKCLIWV